MKKFRFTALMITVMLAVCASAWADVEITAEHFPDETFRACANYFDADEDGVLQDSELAAVKQMNISGSGNLTISSLKGIEYFTSLISLDCRNNQLKELNVSACTKLRSLFCEDNQIYALDLSNCEQLMYLFSANNKLVSLKVRDLHKLQLLDCANNRLETLDLTGCFNLAIMDCSYNRLTNIVLTDCYSLIMLSCNNNQLASVDASLTPYLELLYLNGNPMASADLSACSDIAYVRCDSYVSRGSSSWKFSVEEIADSLGLTDIVGFVDDLGYIGAYAWDEETGEGVLHPAHISLEGLEDGEPFICVDFEEEGEERPPFDYLVFYLFNMNYQLIQVGAFPNTLFASEVPLITTETLAGAFTSSDYGFKLEAEGAQPIAWSVADGTLPEGLTLSNGGYISGTPASAGSFNFTVKAVNEAGKDTKAFTLTVSDAPSSARPAVSTTELAPAVLGMPYTCQLMASGTPSFTWTVQGKLPDGLSMSESGLLTGTPKKKGSKKLTLTVSNDYGTNKKKLTLTVYEPPQITTTSLKDAEVGKKYNFSLNSKGTKPFTWEIGGDLPQGITFDAAKGRFSGTPTVNDSGVIRVTLRSPAGEVSKTFTLKVKATAPKISTKTLKAGTWGKNYKVSISVNRGTAPTTLTLTGALPAGLTFNSETGKIEGTPTEVCTERALTLTAANIGGVASMDYKLTIKAAPPNITTKSLPDATEGSEYSVTLEAKGTPSITWSATGLPEGLTISSADGKISGTPTKSGKFIVKVTATNSAKSVKKSLTLKVSASAAASSFTVYEYNPPAAQEVYAPNSDNSGHGAEVYVVVAELPEVSVDVPGMYDFEVTLSEDVEAGAELVYLAGSSEPCEDDDIAEFCDADGQETDVVPEDRKLTLSVWLNPGRTYKPTLAVKR